jgi:hypothetical protein
LSKVKTGAPFSDHWKLLEPVTALARVVLYKLSFGGGVGSGTIGVTLGLAGVVPGVGVVGGADFGMTLGPGVGVLLGSCPSRSEVMKTIPTTPQATGYFRITIR